MDTKKNINEENSTIHMCTHPNCRKLSPYRKISTEKDLNESIRRLRDSTLGTKEYTKKNPNYVLKQQNTYFRNKINQIKNYFTR